MLLSLLINVPNSSRSCLNSTIEDARNIFMYFMIHIPQLNPVFFQQTPDI